MELSLRKRRNRRFCMLLSFLSFKITPLIVEYSFINPDYGWDALNITESSMRRLLVYLCVFSPFFKYLRAFGTKTYNKDEGFGGFDIKTALDSDGTLQSLGNSSSSILQEFPL
jgi:hypothetical protein